jgi:hypothetical protein
MSTQRRANRTTPAIETDRTDVRCRWFRGCMERAGISVSASRTGGALASVIPPQRQRPVAGGPGITAPLMSIIWLAWAWFSTPATATCRRGPRWLRNCDERSQASTFRVATNSLYSDRRFETFAGLGSLSSLSPPGGAGDCRLSAQRSTYRSSTPHIYILPVRSHLRHPLPQAPAGKDRWAERHDGKRDLYIQHAA